jgi:hypothetical protein
MPGRKYIIACICLLASLAGNAQAEPVDSIPPVVDESLVIDTSLDYDMLLDELGEFLDSILAPRSYFLANLSAANGYFNYTTKNNSGEFVQKKLVLSPTLGYYHKTGPGITVMANVIRNPRGKLNLYQYSITPSFDFTQSRKWTGGFSYTRHITKDSLRFYTTPLQNEISGYFLWRKARLQPGLSASYGWGSRTDVKKREMYIRKLIIEKISNRRNTANPILDTILKIDTIVANIVTKESIVDFLLTPSIRHTFYWLELSKHNDYIKFTPMLAFSFGTQKFGFNRNTGTIVNGTNVQFSRGDVNIDEKLKFKPLSLTLYLRPEYSIGKFYFQPQFLIDYYFPGEKNKLTTFFSVSAGLML